MSPDRAAVLVVEDDDEIRQTLEDVLESAGYRVVTAANGRQALERLEETDAPDLMLVDLMMPVMSGEEFLAAVRQRDELARIPVVVLTAWPLEKTKLGDGVQDFMKKPIALDKLLDTVERYCARGSDNARRRS